MTNDYKRFNSGYSLYFSQFTTWYNVDKTEFSEVVNRFFRNFMVICYRKGYSQKLFLEKLRQDNRVILSRERVKELSGIGRYAGRGYKGFVSFEWLFAIAKFCGSDLCTMLTVEMYNDSDVVIKDRVKKYWAGVGKGVRAGAVDLSNDVFPEALQYIIKKAG